MVSISLLKALTPLMVAKFATNTCIFSPLKISFIMINIIITEIIAITNIKTLNAKGSKIEVSMKLSLFFHYLKFHVVYRKISFTVYISQQILLMFLVLIISFHQNHLILMILVKYVPVL